MLQTIIIILTIALLVGLTTWWLVIKQANFVGTLKVGDKVSYNGTICEIIQKIDSNTFVVKMEVKGMFLAKAKSSF